MKLTRPKLIGRHLVMLVYIWSTPYIFKLRLGASIGRLVRPSVCLSVGLSGEKNSEPNNSAYMGHILTKLDS